MMPRELIARAAVGSLDRPGDAIGQDIDPTLLTARSYRRLRGKLFAQRAALLIIPLLVLGSVVGLVRHESSPWQQIFADEFDSAAPLGGFADSAYASRWSAYDNFADTSGNGRYAQSALSVSDGTLDMYVHTDDGQAQSAAVVPMVNGQWGGQLYGRYEMRFRSDAIPGYKLAFLLWPDTNNWAEGEIDFPEVGSLESGNTLYANVYRKGDISSGDPGPSAGFSTQTQAVDSGWHTASIAWTPNNVTFVLDGNVVGTISEGVPDTSMHLVLQVETAIDASKPDSDAAGHVQVDWLRIDSYAG